MYFILIVALIYRPHPASFLLVSTSVLFQQACGNLDGHWYFFLAALCDFTVVSLVHRFGTSLKSLNIMMICLLSIGLNLFGWLIWFFYQPLNVYTGSFQLLYALATFIILRKDDEDVGRTAFHIDYASHHPDVVAGR